jgi:hypothetical protein
LLVIEQHYAGGTEQGNAGDRERFAIGHRR